VLAFKRTYDRRKFLDRAAKATRSGGRRKRRHAIALYREVLAREPADPDLHRKLAELLARDGDLRAAGSSYRLASEGYAKRGFADHAVGVLRDAVHWIPRDVDLWLELARLELERGRRTDSVRVLLDGRRRFRRRKSRPAALKLLTAASKLDPHDLEIGLDLALALRRAGLRARALGVLARLPVRDRTALRRVRGRQLRVDVRPGTAIGYLRALVLGR